MPPMELELKENDLISIINPKCPQCGSHNVVKNGTCKRTMDQYSAEVYCFSHLRTKLKKNYDPVPAISPPFLSFIFLSLLNILAFSIFDSRILSSSSGLPR